jgi:leader peptidase (prepilin peptidase)/N-methyltransferase
MVPLALWGLTIAAAGAVVLIWVLVALTMIDIDEQLLPDSITLPLLWAGLIINYFGVYCSLDEALWGAVAGYLSLWSVYWAFKLLTGKDGMGFGDFKLLAALGAWMGWQALPVIIIGSSLVGAIIGIGMMVFKGHERQVHIPFGPYLAIAGFITLFWGDVITQSYFTLAGIR